MEILKSEQELLSVMVDGNKLDIITEEICEGEWSLAIENIHGVRSNWCDFFESAEAALEAGRRAIETEGIEEFIATDGFEYLTEN